MVTTMVVTTMVVMTMVVMTIVMVVMTALAIATGLTCVVSIVQGCGRVPRPLLPLARDVGTATPG